MYSHAKEAKGVLLVRLPSNVVRSTSTICLLWARFSVPHDRLFLDALERDLKREKMGLESTTVITGM
jgi:hypothetical protein